MTKNILFKCLVAGIISLLIINTIILLFALINSNLTNDWSVSFKHLSYTLNGERLGFSFNSIAGYAVISIGFIIQYLKSTRLKRTF